MNVVLFGASGMVGQGVLRECLRDASVQRVVTVGRTAVEESNPKLVQVVHHDLFDLSGLKDQLRGHDACFYCLGVSSAGMTETQYRHLTYDLTVSTASTLAQLNPAMTFIYVSGAGFYAAMGPLLRVLYRLLPGSMTTTRQLGLAMLKLARRGWPEAVLEGAAIDAAARLP